MRICFGATGLSHIDNGGRSWQPQMHSISTEADRETEAVLPPPFTPSNFFKGRCQVTLTDADESGPNLTDQSDQGPGEQTSAQCARTSNGPDSQPCGQHLALIP